MYGDMFAPPLHIPYPPERIENGKKWTSTEPRDSYDK